MADTKRYQVLDYDRNPLEIVEAVEVHVSTQFIRFVKADGTSQDFPPDHHYEERSEV